MGERVDRPFFASMQFVKFCAVGVTNTILDVVLYFLLTRYVGFNGNLIYAAKIIAFLVATLNSYVMNSIWTFEGTHSLSWRHMGKFYLAVGSGALINLAVHFADVSLIGINDLVSVLIAALFTAGWGFSLSKRYVFV